MSQQSSREQICQSASQKLYAAIPSLPSTKALVGLDGFVDEIISVVDKRQSLTKFDRVKTIDQLGKKFVAAAGQSSNYELVVNQMKLGGNGPIMANALAKAGLGVSYVGALGYPTLHPVFETLASDAEVITVADAGHTDALEFEDGKIMLGKYTSLNELTWENIVARVGRERLQSLVNGAKLIAMTNWTMIPHMSEVWRSLQSEMLTKASKGERKFFVDLADPEKRTREDIKRATEILSGIQQQADVILGLNLKESDQVAEVLGIKVPSDSEGAIQETAGKIRERMNVSCVVIHPRKGAAAATKDESALFRGPFVREPKISTGAGDHFNAGFCLGRILGMSLAESLCTGTATSGYYVRSAESPSAEKLAKFIAELPPPQG